MIFITTVVAGMLLFQLLVTWEACRLFFRKVNKDLAIQWYANPKVERSYQRRTPGVQTAPRSVWREIIS